MTTKLAITIQCNSEDSAVSLIKRIRAIHRTVNFSVADVVIATESSGGMSAYCAQTHAADEAEEPSNAS